MNTEQETPHPQNKPMKTTVEEDLRSVERKRGRQDSLVCIFEGHWLRNSETYPETERTQKTEKGKIKMTTQIPQTNISTMLLNYHWKPSWIYKGKQK
jgi:hypothetical protein